MSSRALHDRIARRLRKAGASASDELIERLEAYFSFLRRWNARINLTAFQLTDPTDEAIDRLVVEPVVAAAHVAESTHRVIDIGSGSGSPAIPLLLSLPRLSGTMVESKTRKAVFLIETLRHLGVSTWQVETARYEHLLDRPDMREGFEGLTIRAVRVEKPTLVTLQTFVKPGGELYLFQARTRAPRLDHSAFPLSVSRAMPLVESLGSSLTILRKDAPHEPL